MMSISEEMDMSSDEEAEADKESFSPELELFMKDPNMTEYVRNVLLIAENLDILDIIRPEFRLRSGSWEKTKQTTAKYKPLYIEKIPPLGSSDWLEYFVSV